jgi:hypothetical protein
VADPLRLAVGAVGVTVTAVGVALLSSAAAHAHAPADHGVPVEPLGPAWTP